VEFLYRSPAASPHRVGKPLKPGLEGTPIRSLPTPTAMTAPRAAWRGAFCCVGWVTATSRLPSRAVPARTGLLDLDDPPLARCPA